MTRVGYLGPAGTFSEEALRTDPLLPAGAELVPLPTVHRVVVAVADGEVDRALAPIENSLEGSVNEAVDALVHDAPGVCIVGERVLSVRYSLLGPRGAALQDVRVVLSHPQALAQCGGWLRDTLPAAEVQARTSTAEAVREAAAGGDAAVAALGTPVAGELYGAVVLAEFASRDVNLTRIESRPSRRRLGHYVFLLDLDGRADVAGPAAEALAALRPLCEDLRLIGSYPRAADAPTT